MRTLATAFVLLLSTGAPLAAEPVELVVVDKSDRELRLMSVDATVGTTVGDAAVLMRFPVAFGGDPVGHKQREGDGRTPEGRYTLDWRNPNSAFHRSIHVSYPNEADRAAAARRGEDPGGMIMLHGQRNGLGWLSRLTQRFDWTEGCIALRNDDMDHVWDNVPNGTPIVIQP